MGNADAEDAGDASAAGSLAPVLTLVSLSCQCDKCQSVHTWELLAANQRPASCALDANGGTLALLIVTMQG